jgi:hypothetical protein
MPIYGIKFNIHISHVFPTALMKTSSANNRLKLAIPTKWLLFDIKVASVKLSVSVLMTGYKPKMRKPIMNGARNRYPVEFLLSLARFMLPPFIEKIRCITY